MRSCTGHILVHCNLLGGTIGRTMSASDREAGVWGDALNWDDADLETNERDDSNTRSFGACSRRARTPSG